MLGTDISKELEAARGLREWEREEEREKRREGMENSMTGTTGSVVTWDVKLAAIWGKILSANPGQSSRAKRKVPGLRPKGNHREIPGQRKRAEGFAEKRGQNPRAGTTVHIPKSSGFQRRKIVSRGSAQRASEADWPHSLVMCTWDWPAFLACAHPIPTWDMLSLSWVVSAGPHSHWF